MSTIPSSNAPTGQTSALFRIHLDEQRVVEETLDLQKPIYLVVDGLIHRYQLPAVEGNYGLFGGPERRLVSRELKLERPDYASGGELDLAANRAPWWSPVPAPSAPPMGAARPKTQSIPARPGFAFTPKSALLAALGLVCVALLGFLFWPQGTTTTGASVPTIGILAPSASIAEPTATLLPATPTLEPASAAEFNYKAGVTAYEATNWPQAASLLQQVYAYNADYLDVRKVLAATLYNWGMAVRDQGDVAAAREHFQATLAVDPQHTLAADEQSKATLYLEADEAATSGDTDSALTKYRELLKLNGGDYAGAMGKLYELLITQAAALAQAGGSDNLRAALSLYREAASLEVADRSVAQQGVTEIAALFPTPTPKPPPTPTRQPAAKKLRFSVLNYNDDARCISIKITGIVPAGWYFVVNGLKLSGRFDGGGNARTCGLNPGQEVTITVIDGNGRAVAGGGGVPSKGSAIMTAAWK